MKSIIQVVFSIPSIQHRERNCYFTDFFITRCQCRNWQSMWREEGNIFCQEVDVVKNKNLEDVTGGGTVAGKSQMYCPASSVWGNWWRLTLSAFVLLQNIITHAAPPWFSFSLFYILLFSVHIVNVNAAKSSTVLDNLSVNIYRYIYIHIYIFLSLRSQF